MATPLVVDHTPLFFDIQAAFAATAVVDTKMPMSVQLRPEIVGRGLVPRWFSDEAGDKPRPYGTLTGHT